MSSPEDLQHPRILFEDYAASVGLSLSLPGLRPRAEGTAGGFRS
ncbi:Hypothetical protein CAP_6046 [Chondromyces apiculatus DSM 436]|uniref:Uncharacterized protein n=1 Tax=Chondromyces apiculatus DSM 436 TaxID=1192034 RepID=A0A017THH2_9BACT|nr:Hypothetical protein CAP_6046 [Chondromyces apiculatus DSM 436]